MLLLLNRIILVVFISLFSFSTSSEEVKSEFIKTKWSFEGIFGTFDRASLQRGYQVYQEVCSGCHSVQHLSYRNLSEKGGPEFSTEEAKAIAAQFEVEDGPNSDGEMFMRPGRLSDKFVKPYPNVEASTAANDGAYPPDMSVLTKARAGGADYIYSLLLGYEDAPTGFELDDGVYYNKYMPGNKIKMSPPLSDGLVEFKAIIYLIILFTLVYMSKQKVWSQFTSKKEPEEETFDKVERTVTEYEGEDPKTFK